MDAIRLRPGPSISHRSDPWARSDPAGNDIISWATDATLGTDPFATDFGATRLRANPGNSWDPTEIIGSVEAHSSYWDSHSNPALPHRHRRPQDP
jgi:hypothetical protein